MMNYKKTTFYSFIWTVGNCSRCCFLNKLKRTD